MNGEIGSRRSCGKAVKICVVLAWLFPAIALAQNNPSTFNETASAADAARTQGNLPQAITLYKQALGLKPKWDKGWWTLGLLQYQTDDYAGAIDSLTHYIVLAPGAGPAFALKGLCEFETKQYDDSLRDIQRGIAMGAADDPRNGQILRYHEGILLTKLGRFEDAVRVYAWFAQQGIASPELFGAIGLAGLRKPELPEETDPSERRLLTSAGLAGFQFLRGQEEQAREDFQELFRDFPDTPNTHFFYGLLLLARDPDQAIPEFKRELESDPSNSAANIMLAWTYLLQQDPADALPYAEKGAGKDSGQPGALTILGRCLVGTGDLKDGTADLEKARELNPEALEVHIALATAYSEAGRREDAWRERMEALRLAPKSTGEGAEQGGSAAATNP